MAKSGLPDTEGKILEAAKKIFVERGFSGAKMQQIADAAGINKALLHYYFRSKDKLFDIIFEREVDDFISHFSSSFAPQGTIEETLKSSMQRAIQYFSENPVIPVSIINELNRNPQKVDLIKNNVRLTGFVHRLKARVETDIREKKIKEIRPEKLLMAIMSLILFPIMARNVMSAILGMNEKELMKLWTRNEATDFIADAIRYTG